MAWSSGGFGETVVFRYAPAFDTFHQMASDTGGDVLVDDCVFAPEGGSENDQQQQHVTASAELYCPPDVPDISAQDQVVVRGEVYDLTQKPRYWLGETVILTLRRVTG